AQNGPLDHFDPCGVAGSSGRSPKLAAFAAQNGPLDHFDPCGVAAHPSTDNVKRLPPRSNAKSQWLAPFSARARSPTRLIAAPFTLLMMSPGSNPTLRE